MDKLILVGNVGGEPQQRTLPSGNPVATFSLAGNRRRKGDDGQVIKTTVWYRLNAYNALAENTVMPYVHTGSLLYVEAILRPPRVFQRKDGSWGTNLEADIIRLELFGKGRAAPSVEIAEAVEALADEVENSVEPEGAPEEDSIPF